MNKIKKAKTVSSTPSNTNSNSNPFPKLKPKGSIAINQIPKNNDNNKTSQEKSSNSNQKSKENNVSSRLKIFDPNAKNTSDDNDIKHSKTFFPSFFNIKENNNEKDKKKPKKKEALPNKKVSNNENEEKIDENDPKRLSLRNTLNWGKKLFSDIGDYFNDNVINKINVNFNNFNFLKFNNLGLKFEKPEHFDEIEKYWNYEKILLDNNFLDFTSKSKNIKFIAILNNSCT